MDRRTTRLLLIYTSIVLIVASGYIPLWLKTKTQHETNTQLLRQLNMQLIKLENHLTSFQDASQYFTQSAEGSIPTNSDHDEADHDLKAILDARFLRMEEKLLNHLTSTEQSVAPQKDQRANKYTDDERQIAKSNALSIIDNAIENGRWTETDSINLIQHTLKLNHDEYLELLEKYGTAVNQNKLTIEAPFLF